MIINIEWKVEAFNHYFLEFRIFICLLKYLLNGKFVLTVIFMFW